MSKRAIVIGDEVKRKIDEEYEKAFATKTGKERRKEYAPVAITSSQSQYMEHQIFPPNTWLMDLVRFDNGAWYCWFIEANTRFLIVIEGNGSTLTPDAWEQFTARVPTAYFKQAFASFLALNTIEKTNRKTRQQTRFKPVSLIIGDSEKAFWSREMLDMYSRDGIRYERVNTAKDGHIRLAILDRSVRTIRDMLYRLKVNAAMPEDVYRTVLIYNNTAHKSLNNYTPKQVHNNIWLEKRIIQNLKGENWLTSHKQDFIIPDGEEVAVRQNYSIFEKRRSTVKSGRHQIQSKDKTHGYYIVKDEEGNESRAYRRDLKPIRKIK